MLSLFHQFLLGTTGINATDRKCHNIMHLNIKCTQIQISASNFWCISKSCFIFAITTILNLPFGQNWKIGFRKLRLMIYRKHAFGEKHQIQKNNGSMILGLTHFGKYIFSRVLLTVTLIFFTLVTKLSLVIYFRSTSGEISLWNFFPKKFLLHQKFRLEILGALEPICIHLYFGCHGQIEPFVTLVTKMSATVNAFWFILAW